MKIAQKVILISTFALLFSGCVERGYQLTVQPSTHTATAQISIDITSAKSQKSTETYKKMKRAVKRALKKHEDANVKPASHLQGNHKKSYHSTQIKTKVPHVPSISIAPPSSDHEEKETSMKKREDIASVDKKIPLEKESTKASKNDKKISLKEEIALSLSGKEEKESTENTANKEEKKPLQVKEEIVQKNTIEKHPSLTKENKKDIETSTKRNPPLQANSTSKPRKTVTHIQDSNKKTIYSDHYQSADRSILLHTLFQHIDRTYYKFGTSEIHGRIVYLDKNGNEISPHNIKVYLLPQSATLDHWYSSYYLKNKTPSKQVKFGYIHKTYPNIEKSFGFYGVPEGKYYVIILADDPIKQNSKIYIAKKLDIGKYKKVMAVFSKQL